MFNVISAIIFDLDGTLIDSAPSILASFSYVFKKNSIQPLMPLTSSAIGPPLFQTLTYLSGIKDVRKLEIMASDFKDYYDFEACTLSKPYEGVSEGLKLLTNSGLILHIATNKRYTPTKNIIKHLGWDNFFASVYTLDQVGSTFKSKSEMVGRQIIDFSLTSNKSLYVGDRVEDLEAAQNNELNFIGVSWGYGKFPKHVKVVETFDQLHKLIG